MWVFSIIRIFPFFTSALSPIWLYFFTWVSLILSPIIREVWNVINVNYKQANMNKQTFASMKNEISRLDSVIDDLRRSNEQQRLESQSWKKAKFQISSHLRSSVTLPYNRQHWENSTDQEFQWIYSASLNSQIHKFIDLSGLVILLFFRTRTEKSRLISF